MRTWAMSLAARAIEPLAIARVQAAAVAYSRIIPARAPAATASARVDTPSL